MKKLLIALTFSLLLMVAFAAPVLADKGGVPNENASTLGALRHSQAPGQDGPRSLNPGQLGGIISGWDRTVPSNFASAIMPYANPQGANAGPK